MTPELVQKTTETPVMLTPELVQTMLAARQAALAVKFRTTCTDCVPNM